MFGKRTTGLAVFATMFALAGCSGGGSFGSLGGSLGSLGGGGSTVVAEDGTVVDARSVGQSVEIPNGETIVIEQPVRRTLQGGGRNGIESTVQVNKYIWSAALDVLSFLPVQSADPFTGVIITGYGTPPGGGRAYRATILVSDPALDARALNLSLYSGSGPVSAETVRAVENAILTRARQMRSGG
ncbi:DUF3576 domain-containing protein [Celeribacter arenosi]|uniref:DUF3576 domain-containing protein n=1 Tax=Celeribacter arenosi TaxID=792649 RepID=A0ABP7JWU4_9RHOB